jgi:hypothetical protein
MLSKERILGNAPLVNRQYKEFVRRIVNPASWSPADLGQAHFASGPAIL